MKQLTLAAVGLERYAKTTRRATFLAEMERLGLWPALRGLIEPFYPKPGNGRPPIGVERMLRIYLLQQWFNLSDPAVKEALYDSLAMRGFVGIDLGREPVPDDTTVCHFRHLLEAHHRGGGCSTKCRSTWRPRDWKWPPARSSMRPSSTRRPRPRTPTRRAIPRCIKPSRATSGILA
jgi:IS5 family transposase